MGTLYRARDTLLNREVGSKVLLPQWSRHLECSAIPARRALAVLNHPDVLTVHDFGEQ
ncbi:MAG: hypothetical protein LAO03_10650 [Acidobacteriia bacterium]|nr:hypothetical protein [Terriglobia bacterium]